MHKQNILNGLKVLIIMLLVIAISMLVVIRWKSDMIIEKVLSTVQHELVDSLQYTTADMNWFSHFPMMSIRIYDLSVGSAAQPFIHDSDIDVVIGILPLMRNEISINKLGIKDGTISIHEDANRWSYDVFKQNEKSDAKYEAIVNRLVLENTTLLYKDKGGNLLSVFIDKGTMKGRFEDDVLQTTISIQSTIDKLSSAGYTLPIPFRSKITGNYSINLETRRQQFEAFEIDHEIIKLAISGVVQNDSLDLDLSWKEAEVEKIKPLLPETMTKKTNAYVVRGQLKGHAHVSGNLSQKNALALEANANLRNGSIVFSKTDQEIKGLDIDIDYSNRSKPELKVGFKKSGSFGPSCMGSIHLSDLQKPTCTITFDGTLPTPLLNLASIPGLHFESGELIIKDMTFQDLQPSAFSIKTLLNQKIESFALKDVRFTYLENDIKINQGKLDLQDRHANISVEQFYWNNAHINDLKSDLKLTGNNLSYTMSGALCEGSLTTSGVVHFQQHPTITGLSEIKEIKIDQLLHSFSNFDQTFITSENLSGETNLWTQYTLPFDEKWNLMTKQVVVKSAIDIHDGRLQGVPALEDFSKFVDLDDLRDIRFNRIRNYMRIEKGKVILPVMFIQTNALNLSVSGQHGFDEQIMYFIKLNAGQVAAKKLKKKKGKPEYVKASKSGWINMYFALDGSVQNPRYRQYKKAVIAGFEQSSLTKEKLRDELVEQFGYDVYWLEPNEWEDIPEYR